MINLKFNLCKNLENLSSISISDHSLRNKNLWVLKEIWEKSNFLKICEKYYIIINYNEELGFCIKKLNCLLREKYTCWEEIHFLRRNTLVEKEYTCWEEIHLLRRNTLVSNEFVQNKCIFKEHGFCLINKIYMSE